MIKFITSAISKALGFSKVEARGTLALILIMSVTIAASQIYVKNLKSRSQDIDNNDLSSWLHEVESSFDLKTDRPEIDNAAISPIAIKPEKVASPTRKNSKKELAETEVIEVKDLNHASEEELIIVKGIGPAFSKRIVKYRDRLGGFASDSQLYEVYGLKEETIEELSKYFTIQSSPEPFNINADSAKHLASHPYISYDLAWVIINYRKQNGDIQNFDDLKNIKALDEETLEKLRPYLD